MGTQLRYGTAGATGGGFSAQSGTLQPSFEDTIVRYPANDWQRRGPRTWKDRNQWFSLWSFGCRYSTGAGAGQDGEAPIGRNLYSPGLYEPFSCDGPGTQSIKFVQGVVQDASGNVVPGATVQGFVTSNDLYTGEAISRADGSYAVPTQNPGVAHYMVAYIPGSPDRGGTTVNTLIPANLDGS